MKDFRNVEDDDQSEASVGPGNAGPLLGRGPGPLRAEAGPKLATRTAPTAEKPPGSAMDEVDVLDSGVCRKKACALRKNSLRLELGTATAQHPGIQGMKKDYLDDKRK